MARPQHFGYFFSRGFGPQALGALGLGLGARLDQARPVPAVRPHARAGWHGPGHRRGRHLPRQPVDARPAHPPGVRRPEARPAAARAVPVRRDLAHRHRADRERRVHPAVPGGATVRHVGAPVVGTPRHQRRDRRRQCPARRSATAAARPGVRPCRGVAHAAPPTLALVGADGLRRGSLGLALRRRRRTRRVPPRGRVLHRRRPAQRAAARLRPGGRLPRRLRSRPRVRRHPLGRAARARTAVAPPRCRTTAIA